MLTLKVSARIFVHLCWFVCSWWNVMVMLSEHCHHFSVMIENTTFMNSHEHQPHNIIILMWLCVNRTIKSVVLVIRLHNRIFFRRKMCKVWQQMHITSTIITIMRWYRLPSISAIFVDRKCRSQSTFVFAVEAIFLSSRTQRSRPLKLYAYVDRHTWLVGVMSVYDNNLVRPPNSDQN